MSKTLHATSAGLFEIIAMTTSRQYMDAWDAAENATSGISEHTNGLLAGLKQLLPCASPLTSTVVMVAKKITAGVESVATAS